MRVEEHRPRDLVLMMIVYLAVPSVLALLDDCAATYTSAYLVLSLVTCLSSNYRYVLVFTASFGAKISFLDPSITQSPNLKIRKA